MNINITKIVIIHLKYQHKIIVKASGPRTTWNDFSILRHSP